MAIPMPLSAQTAALTYRFAGGSLQLVKDSVEMRITARPVPRAVMRRGVNGQWQPFSPEFRLVYPYRPKKRNTSTEKRNKEQLCFDFFEQTSKQPEPKTPSEQRKRAFEQFRFSLPKPVAHAVEPFRTHQWPYIVFLSEDTGAIDLAQSNSALAFLLAQKMNGDIDLIRSLNCSTIRQRDLLELLGLPASPNAVKIFRKISPASLTGDNWQSILRVVKQELEAPKSRINHLPKINSGVVEILLDPRASRSVTPSFLTEVAEDKSENYRSRIVHLITSTLRMQDEIHTRRHNCETFSNLARLRQVHDEISEIYRRRVRQLIEADQHEADSFRSPPFPGIAGKIEPITSAAGLVDEGEEQGNCVASYASRVRQGHTFIYRVLYPQRATLSLVRRSPLAEWEIGELESRFNTDVNEDTEDYVAAWLERHRDFV
ncbi:MAG: hypothetical protein CMO55_21460 [Verrucomicrobiales bacterium]|nr:hypothetical protein [Verrucomicrobiales bacterium]